MTITPGKCSRCRPRRRPLERPAARRTVRLLLTQCLALALLVGRQAGPINQIVPTGLRPLQLFTPTPSLDLGVVPREQHLGDLSIPKPRRPGVVRIIQPAARK